MVSQRGFLSEALVALAIGLALTLVMVSVWGQDASRRSIEIEGMVERADVREADVYLRMLAGQAKSFAIIDAATMGREMGGSLVTAVADQVLAMRLPFSVIYVYLGRSQHQPKPALWIYQNRFGNIQHHALLDAHGAFALATGQGHLCLTIEDPALQFCHTLLPGQQLDE